MPRELTIGSTVISITDEELAAIEAQAPGLLRREIESAITDLMQYDL